MTSHTCHRSPSAPALAWPAQPTTRWPRDRHGIEGGRNDTGQCGRLRRGARGRSSRRCRRCWPRRASWVGPRRVGHVAQLGEEDLVVGVFRRAGRLPARNEALDVVGHGYIGWRRPSEVPTEVSYYILWIPQMPLRAVRRVERGDVKNLAAVAYGWRARRSWGDYPGQRRRRTGGVTPPVPFRRLAADADAPV